MQPVEKKSLSEYRRGLTKTIVTRSGLEFKVRLLTSPLTYLRLAKKYGLDRNVEDMDSVELAERADLLLRELLQAHVLEPRIVDNPQRENEIGFDELFDEDKTEIFNAIVEKFSFLRQSSANQVSRASQPCSSNQNLKLDSWIAE